MGSHCAQHGNHIQGRSHIGRRQPDDHGRLHCKSSHGQAHSGARHNMVLQVRLGSGYTGGGGHCAIPPVLVWHHEQRQAHDTDCGGIIPGALLRQQGSIEVGCKPIWECRGADKRRLALASSLQATIIDMAVRSSRYRWEALCTSSRTPLADQGPPTSTDTATLTGERA